MKSPTILVIIVTYNGTQWINRCLDSLRQSSHPVSTFVVDNKSSDETVAIIREQYPEVLIHESDENLGFGGANNMGFRYALEHDFDYVYLLNQDAWVMPDTLQALVGAHQAEPNYGILSPLQVNANKDKLDGNFGHWTATIPSILSDSLCGQLKQVYEVAFIMAAHWLISRECLQSVGQFSPIFYHYGEDDNYIHRAKYFGYKVGIVPAVQAVHDREFRETTKEKEAYMLSVRFLVSISDINRPFRKTAYKSYKKMLRLGRKMSKRYKDASIYFSLIPKITCLRKVYQDREFNKSKRN